MPRKKKTEAAVEVVEQQGGEEVKVEEAVAKEPVAEEPVKEEAEKPRAKKAKKEDAEQVVKDEPQAAKAEVPVEKEEKPVEKPKRKRKAKQEIDEETRDTRVLLKGARSKFTIMKGMLERVDVAENAPSIDNSVYGVVHYGNFKIIIPAAYMGVNVPNDIPGHEKAAMYKRYLNSMLGSEIEYVVTRVSETENVASGNRMIAMGIKKKQFYTNKYRNTGMSYADYCMENKIPVEADIMSVSGSQIRLTVLGADAKVLAKDAAWRFTSNLSEEFFPGDTIKVIIKEINRTEDGEISVKASVKETTPNLQIENIADYSVNSTCLGKVSGAINNGYFISVGDNKNGIEAFCDLVHGGITPIIGDVVSCQLTHINYETGAAKAKITRIIRRGNN